jgi:hypothetical protein
LRKLEFRNQDLRVFRAREQLVQINSTAFVGLLDPEPVFVLFDQIRVIVRKKVDKVGRPIATNPTVCQEVIGSDNQFAFLEVVFLLSTLRTHNRSVQTAVC